MYRLFRVSVTAFAAAIAFVLVPSAAATDDSGCLVSFESATLDVCTGVVSPVDDVVEHLADMEAFGDSSIRIVKFEGPIGRQEREALEALDVEILGYVPYYAFLVRMSPALDEIVSTLDGVLWTGPYLPVWKVDVNLVTELAAGGMVEAAGLTQLSVSLHPGWETEALIDALADAPGVSFSHSELGWNEELLVLDFSLAELGPSVDLLSGREEVAAIHLRWPPQYLNSEAGWLHQSAVATPNPAYPVFDRGIFGCGQIIGVLDSGLHLPHCSFQDPSGMTPVESHCTAGTLCPAVQPDFTHRKVGVYYEWSGTGIGDPIGHGTHVTGSVVGNDLTVGVDCINFTTPGGITELDGTAPGAKLIFQQSGPNNEYLVSPISGTILHAATVAYQNGARIHNNSWGRDCRVLNTNQCVPRCRIGYERDSRLADAAVWVNPELALFVAAGNSGSVCGPGHDVAAPGNAKNVFSIGSNQRGLNANNISGFSSRGPASDRRTRPDMTAQGGEQVLPSARIQSALTNTVCTADGMSGTSMAAPTAAGLAALVREYLARGFYPTGLETPGNRFPDPSSALIRSLMINGAVTMTGFGATPPTPNQNQGWGRVHLDNALHFDGDTRSLWLHDDPAGLTTGDSAEYVVTVTQDTEPLKVTLVWHDFPARLNVNPHLVNQLRLEVETPAGQVWTQKLQRPGAGGGLNNADPFQATTATDHDDRNNVHQIALDSPAVGNYRIRVIGINVPGPDQP